MISQVNHWVIFNIVVLCHYIYISCLHIFKNDGANYVSKRLGPVNVYNAWKGCW